MSGLLTCAVAGGLIGAGIGAAFGWTPGLAAATAAGLGALAMVIGGAAGVGLIAAAAGPELERLGPVVIGSGMVRMFVSLGAGAVLWRVAGADGRTLWTSYLAAGVLCLVAETWWGMAASRYIGEPLVRSGASA